MNISDVLSIIGAIGGLITILAGAYQALANKEKTESEADESQGRATKIIIDSAAESVKIVQESVKILQDRMVEMQADLIELKATVETNRVVLDQKSKTIERLESKILDLNRTIIQLQNQSAADQHKITELTMQVEILQSENIELKSQLQKAKVIK